MESLYADIMIPINEWPRRNLLYEGSADAISARYSTLMILMAMVMLLSTKQSSECKKVERCA